MNTIVRERLRPATWAVISLAVILLLGGIRVASTYGVFSQTFDEGAHVAAGTEWLNEGTYTGEPQHPPLARVAAALGPWLYTNAPLKAGTLPERGNEIFHSGDYTTLLSLARAGILPFFLASIVAVWLFARRLSNDIGASVAALLYANSPPVLAHAGLATTDMAAAAGFIWTMVLVDRWLTRPSIARAVPVGILAALAIGAKFSMLLFLAISIPIIFACAAASNTGVAPWRKVSLHSLAAAVACAMTLWAVYRFDFAPLRGHGLSTLEALAPDQEALTRWLAFHPIPAPAIVSGLAEMLLHDRTGHASFLLGEYRLGGWWYYFPVAIAVKTTIPFLLLIVGSIFLLPMHARRSSNWRVIAPILCGAGIVIACFRSDINIGVRHVLPFFPLAAVSAGVMTSILWSTGRRLRFAILVILGADLAVSVRSHPDYLAYFNAFAGNNPEKVLLDSNLDWGQDLLRLIERTKELNIDALRLSYFGTADLNRHDLPPLLSLTYDDPSPGWFAMSEMHFGSHEYPVSFRWLDRFPRYERIGKSIRLYKVPGVVTTTEIPSNYAPLLIPLPLGTTAGANGVTWSVLAELRNASSFSVRLLDLAGKRLSIPPRAVAWWSAPSTDAASYLLLPRNAQAQITGQLVVRGKRADGTIAGETRIPLVQLDRMKESMNFERVPACVGCRRTIRLYARTDVPARSGDADNQTMELTLTARASSQLISKIVSLHTKSSNHAAMFEGELEAIFPELSGAPLSISVTSGQLPVWGFITLSSDGRSQVVLSE